MSDGSSLVGVLRDVDIFRRVPKDLTEPTKLGGCVSVVAMLVLLTLTFLQAKSLLAVTTSTKIEISHNEDEEFRVNLNFTFPSISCDWLSLNVVDIVGHKWTNLSSATIHKYTLHGAYVASRVVQFEHPKSAEVEQAPTPAAAAETGIQVYQKLDGVVELTPETFASTIQEFRFAIVNFFAPWCPYCVALAPIYEEAAKEVAKSIHPSRDAVFCTVNCVKPENFQLCQTNHIQVFPTMRIYRDGSNNPLGNLIHMHEEYRGPRTVEAISQHALAVLKEIRDHPRNQLPHGEDPSAPTQQQQFLPSTDPSLPPSQDGSAPGRASASKRAVRDYASFGCVISGYLKVPRIPGSLIILPQAEGHNFHAETINMSHVINHLSFGQHPFAGQTVPRKYRSRVPSDLGGAYAGKDNVSHATLFLSLSGHLTHEHYIKVVSTTFVPLRGPGVETYEYTVSNNLYQVPKEEIPSVKLVWDIWPMEVVVQESRKPKVEGLCQMFGFLGGVFSFFMILCWLLEGTWKRLIKARESKLS